MSTLITTDTLPGGKHWSMIMRRGTLLRLTDLEGGANAGMLLYNPANLLERYNTPDTLKCQHTFKLTKGHCLYTDMGRVLCSIVEDTFGWHDTVSGNSNKAIVKRKWGEANYQTVRNDWYQNGYDSFLVEAAKYGMGRRDLVANVNWFSKVAVDDAGRMMFDASAAKAGASVALRFEMDTLVLFHTCPHPLDPAKSYPRKPVQFEVSEAPPVAADDACKTSAPENGRGFENNRLFHACACGGH
jgi:urea carboxylase-associated protein 2